MLNDTMAGWFIPVLTCCAHSIQIFRCTEARYQSPKGSLPSGTPAPGGAVSEKPCVADAALRALPDPPSKGTGAGRSGVFFLVGLVSGSGRPVRFCSCGGLMIFGG